MVEKSGEDFFKDCMPFQDVWYIVLIVIIIQLFLFFLSFGFFWLITTLFAVGALLVELIVVVIGTMPYRYLFWKSEYISEMYRKKYGDLAGQKYWFRFEFLTVPLLSASLYFPLLLISYSTPNFRIISFNSNFLSAPIFPIFITLPISVFFFLMGVIIRKASFKSGYDEEHFLYIFYPKQGRLITDGIYKFIRHPRFLCRIFFSVSFFIIANNILAFFVVLIHLVAFYSFIPSEDKELERRFGNDFVQFKKKTPSLIPHINNLKCFLRFVFNNK